MFKIPKWEDDVPKSNVDFGNTAKKLKTKAKNVTEHIKQKTITKISKNKKKIKNKIKIKNIVKNSPTDVYNNNNFNKNDLKKSKIKNIVSVKHTVNIKQTPTNSNQPKIKEKKNVIAESENKKKKAKKRKHDDGDSNKETKFFANHSNKPSKAKKKKKFNDNQEETEDQLVNGKINNNTSVLAKSKKDQKKEKFKKLLEMNSNRNPINVSGNNLRQRMLERLKAAQFRYLNEKLYTTSGSEAQKLFQSDPEAFHTYHEGYQQQLKKWPVNPLDLIVKRINKMPKSHIIADMGCGEAALSKRVQQAVRSFDLVATSAGVEACDMARTPLLSESVDAAVYCLALMGTDLTQYLLEANRVLKVGGHLLIAEVESRFDKVETFTADVQRLGFKLKNVDKTHQVFFFMEFTKVGAPPSKKAKLPAITLKPCLFKKR